MRLLAKFVCCTFLTAAASAQQLPDSPAPLLPQPQQPAAGTELPESVISLRQMAAEYYYTGNSKQFVQVMEKLHELRPYNGEYMYQLVIAYARANESSKAYNLMLIMQQQGLSYDFTGNEDVANIRGTQVFEYLSDLMVRAGEPMGNGSAAFVLPEDFILPEAIDWDAKREKFIIGNVAEGRILLVDRSGSVKPFIESDSLGGPWGVYDLKIDAARELLWVSSAASSSYRKNSDENRGKSGLFKFDLRSGKLLDSYLVTETDKAPSGLANIALAADGTVYVADSLRPVVYKLAPGNDSLEPAFASPGLVSIRGLALSADNKLLYLADYELGVLVLHLELKRATHLVAPDSFNIGGIDGMYFWNGHLVVIQNGNSPERVMRLEIDPGGTQVTNVRPLEVAHPQFAAPNYGTVVGDDLYYFGNSQWHTIQADGTLSDDQPVSVMKTSLLGGADLVSPELDKFMDQIREQKGLPPATEG
jgi:sugar lactone lactonase YvrE